MSFDIACVKRSFAFKCFKENINLGQIMEENPESIPDLGNKSFEAIKNFLLYQDEYGYEIEFQNDKEIYFRHKKDKSVQVRLSEKVVFFKSGFSDQWTILNTTALITIEQDPDIMRFDFQDGKWG
jgi:hypothetical protein